MSTITMKSTKQEMFEAYTEMKKKLDIQASLKDDPIADQEKARKTAVVESADAIVRMNILAPEITEKYQNLCEAVKMKEDQLKELYEIESEANSLIALINAHKDKKHELEEKYRLLTEEAAAALTAKKQEIVEEINVLKAEKEEILKNTNAENEALIAANNQKRSREEEEYAYNLKRARKLADDKWEDEKATREKAIAEKEADLAKTEAELAAREEKMEELETKVAEIPELIAKAMEEGKKAGKAEAEKSHVFEVRSINTKNEYEQKTLQDKVERLTVELTAANVKVDALQEKLDAAYTQMRDLASETVKSANGVKIIDRENTGK